jgi:hypothetical protein
MKDLPFGIWFAARTEAIFGVLYLTGGLALYGLSDSFKDTPTLLGSTGSGTLAFLGLLLALTGVLDLVAAISLTRLSAPGFAAALSCSSMSAAVSAYLLSAGFTMGAMNLFVNAAVSVYLIKWDVRQEYF